MSQLTKEQFLQLDLPAFSNEFKTRIASIEDGRFKDIAESCSGLCNSCAVCDYFNPYINNSRQRHMCHVLGSCPAASWHPKLQDYIWKKLVEDGSPVIETKNDESQNWRLHE